jgi:heat shock protein HslJ
MKARMIVAPLAMLLTVVACGQPAESGGPDPVANPLAGHTFLSTAVTTAGQPHQLLADTRVSLRFTDDDRVLAEAGCNNLSGKATVTGDRIEIDQLAMTQIGCDPQRHQQDKWLSEVLTGTLTYRLENAELVLTSGDTELTLLDREAAEPDLGLVGPTWTVDTLVDGQTASSVPAGVTATLVFDEDRVAVSGGCNSGTAAYDLAGSTITFTKLTMTLKACADEVMRVEQTVVAVLDGKVDFEVDANRLTLDHPSGKGIQLGGQ